MNLIFEGELENVLRFLSTWYSAHLVTFSNNIEAHVKHV